MRFLAPMQRSVENVQNLHGNLNIADQTNLHCDPFVIR